MKNSISHHPQQIVTLNNVHIAYDSFGHHSAQALVLIMGLGAQMIFWDDDFCRLLANQGFWVIRFDNRDSGCSTWDYGQPPPNTLQLAASSLFARPLSPPYTLEDMADDVLGLLNHLGITKAHVVGASMGGMIAQCLALKAPHRVLSLTSIMSTPGQRALIKPSKRILLKMLEPLSTDKHKSVQHGVKLWRLLHGNYYPFDLAKAQQLVSLALQRGINALGVRRQLAAILAAPDRTSRLAGLKLPCLVIHGQADPLLPVVNGYATAKAVTNAKLVIYKGMGHTLPSQLWPAMAKEIQALR